MTTQIRNEEEQKELALRIGNAVLSGLETVNSRRGNPQEQFRTQFDNVNVQRNNRPLFG